MSTFLPLKRPFFSLICPLKFLSPLYFVSLREASFRPVLFRLYFITCGIFCYFVVVFFLVAILLSLSAPKSQMTRNATREDEKAKRNTTKDEITPK